MSDRVAGFFWAGSALFGAILTGEMYAGYLDVQPVATVAPVSEPTRAVQSKLTAPGNDPEKQRPSVNDLIATSMGRPLFSATRRPIEQKTTDRPADPELTDVRLTGIVIDGDHRTAIFAKQGAKPLVRAEGEMVSDWRLENVGPRAVTLTGPAGTTVFEPKSDPNLVRPARQTQLAPGAPKAKPNRSSQPAVPGAQSPSATKAQSPSAGAEPTTAQPLPTKLKKIRTKMPQASIDAMPAPITGMLAKSLFETARTTTARA